MHQYLTCLIFCQILMRESPELFELLEDFHAKVTNRKNKYYYLLKFEMVELKERVYPLVLKLRERELIDSEARQHTQKIN